MQGRRVHSGGADLFGQFAAENRPADFHFQGGGERRRDFNQMNAARGGKFRRNLNPEISQKRNHVTGPAHGHGDGTHRIFQSQVPADDPCEQLAQRRVAVSVGAAGHGNQRGEFGITQRGERRDDARQREGKHHRRSGVLRRRRAGQHEDARADDAADAQQHQIQRPQRAMEAVVGQRLRLQVGDTFSAKQIHSGNFSFVPLLNELSAGGSQANAPGHDFL